ncbi:MAG: hypothetical protein ACK4QW_04990 [Alphaproteobacteria bacterium]
MTTYAIFVAAAENGWKGPPIATWDAALVQEDNLVLKDQANPEKLVGCALSDVERVRWCALDGTEKSCVQLDVTIRGTGKLFAYASAACLDHLQGKGVDTAEMGEEERDVFQPLWTRLSAENADFTTEIVSLVNENLT